MALTRPRAYQIYDIDYKQATRVVTTTNITLAGGAPNTVDSISLALNDRVLVTGQSAAAENGIYYVTTLGTGSNGTWTRSIDTDATGELLAGTIVMVTEGAVYQDTQWKLTTNDPITIGVTALTFVQNYSTSSISAGTSNVVVASNSNVTISSAGTANVLTISSTGTVTTGTVSATGNVTGNYFIGNGSQLTGVSSYANANAAAYGESGWAGNIIPSANAVYNLGNVTNQWKSLYLSNSTLYIANVAINMGTGNVLQVAGANVVTAAANGEISTAGNITGANINAVTSMTAGTLTLSGNTISSTDNTITLDPATTGTGGTLIVQGNLSVTGNVTYINSNNITTNDLTINVANNAATASAADGGGLGVGPAGSEYASFTYNSSGNTWTISNGATVSGIMSASGNVTGGNILTGGLISATGNITSSGNISATYFIGNGSQLTGISGGGGGGGIAFTSQANTPPAGPNNGDFWYDTYSDAKYQYINDGDSSQWVDQSFPTSFASITANTISATANVTSGNILTSGLVSATGNITSAANVTGGNVVTSGLVSATGNITSAANVAGGNLLATTTVSAASHIGSIVSVTANVTGGNLVTSGLVSAVGNVTGGNLLSAGNAIITGRNLFVAGTYSAYNQNNRGLVALNGSTDNVIEFNTANTNRGYVYHAGTNMSVINTQSGTLEFGTSSTTRLTIASTGAVSATGNITSAANIAGGNANITTTINTTSVSASGNLRTAGTVSATGNINGGNLISAGTITTAGNIVSSAANATANIGSATIYFNTVHAKATSAQYADVAEKYTADQAYAPGTVIEFGGYNEVTQTTTSHSWRIAGVVSTNPAYIMNAGADGDYVVEVALLGRVPCRVIGPVTKGDRMVSSDIPGVAQSLNTDQYEPGCVIGKALESWNQPGIGLIEVVVGRI